MKWNDSPEKIGTTKQKKRVLKVRRKVNLATLKQILAEFDLEKVMLGMKEAELQKETGKFDQSIETLKDALMDALEFEKTRS